MPLSRLENFLKNAEGNILYVNPSDFDATDNFENRGNSLTRPFRTIQRALIEAARFSYQVGRNNDKIDTTTILVYPGTHYIDNRPGFSIANVGGSAVFKRYLNFGWTTSGASITEFNENSNFDIFDENNDLHKFNSVTGGVILPRGTSIVGLDLRKTKIRPMYVPDPENNEVDRSAIFRVTGTCYFTAFSIFDADINRAAYKDSSVRKVVPNFSHHKLTTFEYADGANLAILGSEVQDLTDLEMYYYKITHAYGDTSGRGLANYPAAAGTDFEPSVDEFRIVGDLRADSIGITSIRSGDGIVATSTIRIDTTEPHGLFKDTPVLVSGITTNISSYNGSFIVSDVIDENTFTYTAPEIPTDPLPDISQFINSSVLVESDSVSSASPYIFSCTLRSVYGLNGMHADGSKATGFKSMLVAQFTGISLQKDDNAFILYDEETGIYNDNQTVAESEKPLHINSRAIYKPDYESIHIKTSNNAIIQAVSVFAIGYAKHFVSDTGGDQSITNSNSNFGAVALESTGFRPESFDRDDVGYITHVIPPREPNLRQSAVSWLPLDALKIINTGTVQKLWLADYFSKDIPPPIQIDSYRIGARRDEKLYLTTIVGTAQSTYSTPVLMPVPTGIGPISIKTYEVGRAVGINSVSNNIITLTENHQLFNGETVRIYSDTGEMPANVESAKVYYAYTSGLNANQIKLSPTLNDALSGNTVTGISNGGGVLKVISSVSDKAPGDYGHPVQYDDTEKQWYVLGHPATFFNTVYEGIVGIGTVILGNVTGATFVQRFTDNRGLEDRLYKMRYVIPKEFVNARPPTDGFIIQESKNVGVGSVSYLTSDLDDVTQLRNPKIIVDAIYTSGTTTIKTEIPHNLVPGDRVIVRGIISANNTTGDPSVPYNGEFTVASVPSTKTFTFTGLTADPGVFRNLTNQRATQQQIESLPTVQRSKYKNTLFIYRSSEIKKHIPGTDGQDGIYNITAISGSISPDINVGYGLSEKRFNQDIRNLYPQQDRDNYNPDPIPTTSHSDLSPIGKISTNDKRGSITKEALNYFSQNNRIGYAVTGASISGSGSTTITLYTDIDHNLNSIKSINLIAAGVGYNNSAGISSILYSTELVNNSLSGRNATVKATISVGNTVSSVSIVDAGSAYGVGNTLTVSPGFAAAPTNPAIVEVTEIVNNVGDTLELNGFLNPELNGIFKIIAVPSSRTIEVYNENAGIGLTYYPRNDALYPIANLVSNGVSVNNLNYNKEIGIATITCLGAHGLLPGNTFNLVGSGSTFFTGINTVTNYRTKFQVSEVVGVNTFTFTAGISTIAHTINPTGVTVHKFGFSSQGKALGAGEENLGGRGAYVYAGLTTTTNGDLSATSTTVPLTSSAGIKKGDYLAINAEIVRVVAEPLPTSVNVIRGQFSTGARESLAGIAVKKVRVLPVEIRRHSILRASGHTFEYLGYGPGNYSTGLPVKQDRVLSDTEVIISQAREQNGGTVVYTGMNDRGEFYNGATKLNGATGEEEVIEAPIVTYFGDDAITETTKRNSGVFDDVVIKERLTVEGGENNNQTSQFYGPVNFSEKVTNTSENGLETRDLYIKGLASQAKLITVGISTPTTGARSGDVNLISTPDPTGHIGHVFVDGDWRRWGMISRDKNRDFLKLDQIGVGQSDATYPFLDALEVNGTTRVKNLYVGGAVTFASNQTFAGVTYDDITVNDYINFVGTGGSTYTIKHANAEKIAQFQNLEVTGYAATFTNAVVKFENSFNSTFPGISTVAGTLQVGALECSAGFVTATALDATAVDIGTLSVGTGYIGVGIVTNFKSEVGTVTNFYSNVGIITSLTGFAATITTVNGTSGFFNGFRVNSSFATPNAYINIGIVTTISGTTLVYEGVTGTATTTAKLNISQQFHSPLGYVNTGIITTLTTRTLRGASSADPLTAYINVGVVTSIVGTAGTYTHLRASTSLVANNGLYANVGFVTHVNGTQQNLSGVSTAQRYVSTVATGTAPLQVTSTTKVTNLNADLLDGFTTADTNTASTVVVRNGLGGFAAGIITGTSLRGPLQYSIGVSSPLTITSNTAFDNSTSKTIAINATSANTVNYVVQRNASGNFSAGMITANLTGNVTGNATSADQIKTSSVATNANHYLTFVNSNNGTGTNETLRTDAGIYYNPSTNNLFVTGDITAFASDIRLKTNIETIDNAIEKVLKLSGFTYEFNEKGQEIGFESGVRHSGVSAQEVQAVLPEAVAPAPGNDEYLTVKYEKLVPLLIEAIKDLKGEITELRQELDELKGNK